MQVTEFDVNQRVRKTAETTFIRSIHQFYDRPIEFRRFLTIFIEMLMIVDNGDNGEEFFACFITKMNFLKTIAL